MNTREIVDSLRYLCEDLDDNIEFLDGSGSFSLNDNVKQAVMAAIEILERLDN